VSTLLNFTTNIDSNGRVLTLDSAGTIGVSGAISGGGSILKLGGGVASLSASNSYLGNTTISAGTLTIANGFALGAGSGSTLVGQNALLELTGSITVAESVTLRGVLLSTSGNNTMSGTISLGLADSRVNVDASSQLSLSGILTGP